MYFVYIIYSAKSDLHYVGHSSDPWKRLEQHNTNESDKFTGKHRNWELLAVFSVSENKGDTDKAQLMQQEDVWRLNCLH